ncbi:hypothetical protein YC2023_089390 [Brassica napus]
MEVPINVTFMGQLEVMVNPQSKRYIAYLSRKFPPVTETCISSFFVGALFVLCDARFPKFQLANGINIQSQSVTLCFDERFDERIWDPGIAYSWRIEESMEGKIWLYRFQSKRISMSWIVTTKHVISCSRSVWDELRCNIWIAFNDLLREKRHLLTRIESHKKDLKRPRTKWRKASESACPTNALESILISPETLRTQPESRVIFNVSIYDCSPLYPRFIIDCNPPPPPPPPPTLLPCSGSTIKRHVLYRKKSSLQSSHSTTVAVKIAALVWLNGGWIMDGFNLTLRQCDEITQAPAVHKNHRQRLAG